MHTAPKICALLRGSATQHQGKQRTKEEERREGRNEYSIFLLVQQCMAAPLLCRVIHKSARPFHHIPLLLTRSLILSPLPIPSLLSHGVHVRWFSAGRPIGQPMHETHPHLIGPGECMVSLFSFSLSLSKLSILSHYLTHSHYLILSIPSWHTQGFYMGP